MFRRAAFGAVAALTVGVLAVGCSEDGDTVVGGGATSARPDAFPGSQVDVNNTASDARAATPADQLIQSGPNVYWNSSNGTAIILYETESDQANQNDRNLLAHFFDGSKVHPAVQIRGLKGGAIELGTGGVQGFKVLWLNTTGNTNTNASGRNGDAIILFTRNDEAPVTPQGADVDEDSNRRLWATYFDVSAVNATASGTVVRGFDTAATVIDQDNVRDNVVNDPDVETFGFVSNSLRFTHEFTNGINNVDSGDVTDYVYFVWGKNTQSGTSNDAATRFRFVPFDLTQTGNAMPTTGGTDLAVAGTYATGAGAAHNAAILVHNNVMLWDSATVNQNPTDNVVTVTVFNKTTTGGGVSATLPLGEPIQAGERADNTFMPQADDFYGDDHNLNAFYAFYRANGYAPTNLVAGSRNPDNDLMVTMIPNVASPTAERVELDAHTGTVTTTGDLRPGDRGDIVTGEIQTRIDRSGNYISALWLQDNTDLSTSGGQNTKLTDVLWSRAVQVRTGTSARTLANSVSTAGPLNSPSLGTGTQTAGANAQLAVSSVQFQQDLAGGQTVAQGNGFADRGCSFQGNNLRMNWIYQQRNDQNGGGVVPNQQRLLVNGMTVTLGANDTTAPQQTLVSTSEVVIETVARGYTGADLVARAFDAGDISRTGGTNSAPTATSGRVIVFFVSNDNTKLDNTVNGQFTEQRLFAWENNTVVTISTNPTGTSDFFQVAGFQGGIAVPVDENTAQKPSHVASTLHVYWSERTTKTGHLDLGTRSYDLTKTQPATGAAPALGERFVPATSSGPLFIDHQTGGRLFTVNNNIRLVRNNSTVGVFFDEDGRLYYQQTSGSANGYYADQGRFDPQLVDNDSDNPLELWALSSPNKCNNLPDTIVFFTKRVTDSANAVARGQIRVMD